MSIQTILTDAPNYPLALHQFLGQKAPDVLYAIGNIAILEQPLLAVFCSVQCPASLILKTYDHCQQLAGQDVIVISGFQSPAEQECRIVLQRSATPLIHCHAHRLPRRLAPDDQRRIEAGQLLLLSPFADTVLRASQQTAAVRNRMIAALAGRILVAHAAPGGKTERFCQEILSWGKPLFTFSAEANQRLLQMGAQVI